MKTVAIVVSTIAVMIGTQASAADMLVKAPPKTMAPAPAYSWTGFYIGGNAGYGWKDPTVTVTGNDSVARAATCGGVFGGTCVPPASFNIKGALGGLQAGYNWSTSQNWLVGLEADFDWSNVKGAGASNFILGSATPAPSNFQASEHVKWFGTVRGRVGFLPANNFLLYATGGLAYGRVDVNAVINSQAGANVSTGTAFSFACISGPNCFVGGASRTGTGFAAGGGGEYVLWQNLSVKAEYLYVNLGSGTNVNVVAQAKAVAAATPSSFTAAYSRPDFHVVRVGLNWKL